MERSLVIGNAVGHMKPHLDEETGLEEEKWNGGTSAEGVAMSLRAVQTIANTATNNVETSSVIAGAGGTAVGGWRIGLLRGGIPTVGGIPTAGAAVTVVGLGVGALRLRGCRGCLRLCLGCGLGVGLLLRGLRIGHLPDGGVQLRLGVGVGLRVGDALLGKGVVRLVDGLREVVAGGVVRHLPVRVPEGLARAVNTLLELVLRGVQLLRQLAVLDGLEAALSALSAASACATAISTHRTVDIGPSDIGIFSNTVAPTHT